MLSVHSTVSIVGSSWRAGAGAGGHRPAGPAADDRADAGQVPARAAATGAARCASAGERVVLPKQLSNEQLLGWVSSGDASAGLKPCLAALLCCRPGMPCTRTSQTAPQMSSPHSFAAFGARQRLACVLFCTASWPLQTCPSIHAAPCCCTDLRSHASHAGLESRRCRFRGPPPACSLYCQCPWAPPSHRSGERRSRAGGS